MEINGSFNPVSAKRARDLLGVTSEFTKRSLNVANFGAKMDGTDDTAATTAARGAVSVSGTFGVIDVGPGKFGPGAPTAGPSTPVLWRLSGNTYGDGSPVAFIGGDIVETFLPNDGGKFFGQGSTTPSLNDMHTVTRSITHSGGGGGVASTSKINTNITGNPGAYIFGLTSSVQDRSTIPNQAGNNVGVYAQYFRYSGGTPGWALAAENIDFSNQTSGQSAALIGAEVLLKANRADDAKRRVVLDAVVGQANTGASYEACQAQWGYRLSGFGGDVVNAHCVIGFGVTSAILDAAYDASQATFVGGQAISYRVGKNKKIDFSDNSTRTLMWNEGGALQYTTPNGLAMELKDDGTLSVPNFAAGGQVKGATAIFTNLPTSSSGLPSGTLWRNGTAINIVP